MVATDFHSWPQDPLQRAACSTGSSNHCFWCLLLCWYKDQGWGSIRGNTPRSSRTGLSGERLQCLYYKGRLYKGHLGHGFPRASDPKGTERAATWFWTCHVTVAGSWSCRPALVPRGKGLHRRVDWRRQRWLGIALDGGCHSWPDLEQNGRVVESNHSFRVTHENRFHCH